MAPSPYLHLSQDPANDDDDDSTELLPSSTAPAVPVPLPPHPPILFGSTTSLPSSGDSYRDEDEKRFAGTEGERDGEDRFVQEGQMEDGLTRSSTTRGWRAVDGFPRRTVSPRLCNLSLWTLVH